MNSNNRIDIPGSIPLGIELSDSQKRFWLLHQLAGDKGAGTLGFSLRLQGDLDVQAFGAAISRSVELHSSLRTNFRQSAVGPVQQVSVKPFLGLCYRDLLSCDNPESEFQLQSQRETEVPFDLEEGALFRASLYRLTERIHVAVFTAHHIVLDGLSVTVLFKDIARFYRAFLSGTSDNIGDRRQYLDFCADKRAKLTEERISELKSNWSSRFLGEPQVLDLPTDYPRPSQINYRIAWHRRPLPKSLVERVAKMSLAAESTAFGAYLSAFGLVLSRWCRQDSVTIGVPVSGRKHRSYFDVVGCFVNTLPVQLSFDHEMLGVDLIGLTARALASAYTDQDLPFESIVNAISPARDSSRSALVQAVCNYFKVDVSPWTKLGFEANFSQFHRPPHGQDLSLSIEASGDNLTVYLEYATDLFSHESARRILDGWLSVLEAMTADSSQPVAELPLFSEADASRLLAFSHGEAASYEAVPLDRLFANQVSKTPDATAVVHFGKRLTYREVDTLSTKLAVRLQSKGVALGCSVATLLPEMPELVIAWLAIVKLGAAFVPLDLEWPEDRIRAVVSEQQCLVISTAQAQAALNFSDRDWVPIERLNEEVDGLGTVPTSVGLPVYTIYTSGSTGLPKGVINTQEGLLNRLHWMTRTFGSESANRALKTTRQIYDSAVWQIFWPLINGGAVVLVDVRTTPPLAIFEMLRDEAITIVDFVPSLLASFRDELSHEDEHEKFPSGPACFSQLRIVIFGGEEIGQSGVEWFLERSDAKVVNLYGPTEASIGCIFHEVAPGHVGQIPIGRPIDNVAALILDENYQLVPAGVPGELCLGGVALAQGYSGNPALTADRFVPNPYGLGTRLYRTGDIVKRNPDGAIAYLGRLDSQIKLNGVRIEPSEVESALKQVGSVREAVVTLRIDGSGIKRLVAYLVLEGDTAAPSSNEIRSKLSTLLPPQLIPSAYVTIDKIPLGNGGKLDLKALPAPQFDSTQAFVEPETETEKSVAAIWLELLGCDAIGRHDNFFDRGGHSLMATRAIARVRTDLGFDVKLRDLFETADLAGFAQRVDASSRLLNMRSIKPLHPSDSGRRPVPLSFNQQQLWVLENLGYGGAAYNLSKVLRIEGDLDIGALSLALTASIGRHSSLRTRFIDDSGVGYQLVDEPWPVLLRPQGVGRENVQLELERLIEESFDINADRLFRCHLFRLGPNEHVLAFVMHHIISDGWSMSILLDELVEHYNDLMGGRQIQNKYPLQYLDYALWQRESIEDSELNKQIQFWVTRLEGAPPYISLPTDRPRPITRSDRGTLFQFTIPAQLSEAAENLAMSLGVTLYSVLISTFQLTLSKWCGQKDVVIGTLNAGRSRKEVESVVGYFVNMVALRCDLRDAVTFNDLVRQNANNLLDIDGNLDVTFDRVVEAVRPTRDASRQPIFQVLFALQNMPRFAGNIAGLQLQEIEPKRSTSKLDLSAFVTPTETGLEAILEYASDIFDKRTIEKFADRWMSVLSECVDEPSIPLEHVSLVLDDERETLLADWCATSPSGETTSTLHALFNQQVARDPDAIAISFGNDNLSYRKLGEFSDAVATELIQRGIVQSSIIGLCLDRGPSLLVGALGIIKAGGAYLPLDPTYPSDRLDYMLGDAKVTTIITDEMSRKVLRDAAQDLLLVDEVCAAPLSKLAPELPSVSPDAPAYVIYTSGSTGKPKGVVVTHHNVTRLLSTAQSCFRFNEHDVWTLFHSFSFDFSVWEVWGALAFGGRLVVVPYLVSRSPSDFAALLSNENVTVLNQTPSAFGALSNAVLAGDVDLPSLRYVIFGGEKLVIGSLREWFDRFGDNSPKLVNMYGITETTVHVTYREIHREDLDGLTESVIGRPLSDLQVFILDDALNLVPIGTPGEMYVAGQGLSLGYLNQPALTAERFIPSPFSPPGRLYKTGDLARWRPNGDLDYLGRIDQQVKLRGFRIEPGEIEAALVSIIGIKEAAVILAGSGTNCWLAAYVVGNRPKDEYLKAILRSKLPDHMVPSSIMHLDSLPLTANGKLNREALPSPVRQNSNGEIRRETWTKMQRDIADIFEDVLPLDKIDLNDNFFEVGGHSLLAIQLCKQIEHRLDIKVSVIQLFERPTVAALASSLQSPHQIADATHRIPLRSVLGASEAIFFLPTALGTGVLFSEIAQKLPPEFDVFTCRLPGSTSDESPLETVEKLAKYCLSQIAASGDYRNWTLIGWSFGGVLAYEVARQMAHRGLQLPDVIAVDAYVATKVGSYTSAENDEADLKETETFHEFLRNILDRSLENAADLVGDKVDLSNELLDGRLGDMRAVFRHSIRALRSYDQGAFEGHLYEIRANESSLKLALPGVSIEPLAAKSRTVITLPGDHFSIMNGADSRLLTAIQQIISPKVRQRLEDTAL